MQASSLRIIITILMAFSSLVRGGSSADFTLSEVADFLERKTPFAHYQNKADSFGLQDDFISLIALNFDEALTFSLLEMLSDENYFRNWNSAWTALRVIATVQPSFVPEGDVIKLVTRIEQSESLSNAQKLRLLNRAYPVVAHISTQNALDFIKARTTFDFWKDNEIEHEIVYSPGDYTRLESGQTIAIRTMGRFHQDEADQIINDLIQNPLYTGYDHIEFALLRAQSFQSRSLILIAEAKHAYEVRSRGEGLADEKDISEEGIEEESAIIVAKPQAESEEVSDLQTLNEEEQKRHSLILVIITAVFISLIALLAKRKRK